MGEVELALRMKRRYLMAFCSPQMVQTIIYASGTMKEKQDRFERAKKIARTKGRERVWLEDWNEANL